jgi:putative intracellular protease/amidase
MPHLTSRPLAGLLLICTALAALAGEDQPTTRPSAPSASAKAKTTYVCQMANHHHMTANGPAKEYDRPGICPTDGAELIAKNSLLRVAVLVFEGVQDIDYAGPMEVFGQTGANLFTVGATTEAVHSTYGIRMQPDFDIDHAPAADVLLVPGGNVGAVMGNPKVLAWLRQRNGEVSTVLSVCTGAFILGQAGLLDGLSATTIAGASPQLAKMFPKAHVVTDRRYVDNGRIVTTGGLSAGIDGALHVVDRELGRLRAEDVARGLEYEWRADGQGGFGLLAGNQLPDVAHFLPDGAYWERFEEGGDTQRWTVRGHLGLDADAQAFLDASVKQLMEEAWVPVADADRMRRSFARTQDGKTWRFVLTLARESEPSTYQLTLAVRQTHGGPSASEHRQARRLSDG